MKILRKIIDSKNLENSQENTMMKFDLVKLQFCNLNVVPDFYKVAARQ